VIFFSHLFANFHFNCNLLNITKHVDIPKCPPKHKKKTNLLCFGKRDICFLVLSASFISDTSATIIVERVVSLKTCSTK
jgi:hypothetical protein